MSLLVSQSPLHRLVSKKLANKLATSLSTGKLRGNVCNGFWTLTSCSMRVFGSRRASSVTFSPFPFPVPTCNCTVPAQCHFHFGHSDRSCCLLTICYTVIDCKQNLRQPDILLIVPDLQPKKYNILLFLDQELISYRLILFLLFFSCWGNLFKTRYKL